MANQEFDERKLGVWALQMDSGATPGSYVYLNTTNVDLQRCDVLLGINSDTIDHLLSVDIAGSGAASLLGQVKLPAGCGYGGVPPVDMIAALLPSNHQYFWLWNGNIIGLAVGEAINAGKLVTVNAMAGSI